MQGAGCTEKRAHQPESLQAYQNPHIPVYHSQTASGMQEIPVEAAKNEAQILLREAEALKF